MKEIIIEYNTSTEVNAFLKGLHMGQTKNILVIDCKDNMGCKTIVLREYDDKSTRKNKLG